MREEVEMMGASALLYDKETESRFGDLRFNVVRFAMDHIRKAISDGISKQKPKKDANCSCACSVNYDIPCYHILSNYDVIPLHVVPVRWRIVGKYMF